MTNTVMDPDAIFSSAIALASPEEREAFIAQACGHDAELRQKVAELVAAHFAAGGRRHGTVAGVAPAPAGKNGYQTAEAPSNGTAAPGVGVGPYKLVQALGETGKDIVFLAEQQQPARRLVALKIIKPGTDGQAVLARFEAERQRLARLDHPNLARIFDAGTLPDAGAVETPLLAPFAGRPYFVMELVKGIPITQYCDEHRLALPQRLELFVAVCQAVQHAHQKGVLHGDLRPGHVLVSSVNNKPVPRVTDFGVAGATAPKLTERTAPAGPASFAGALEYLSPEQAQYNAADVDTRSDVHALGVLLYELLTGTTPLARQRLLEVGLTEALRLIQEEQALPPSTRLSESRDRLAALAAQRQADPTALVKAVSGELDAIVLKALQNDRARRYDSAGELARDVQRYLTDEPVEAFAAGAAYRLRKLGRKHRRGATLTVALLLGLAGAGVLGTALTLLAGRTEAEARAQVQEAEQKRKEAVDAKAALTSQRDQAESARQATAKALEQALAAQATAKNAELDSRLALAFLQDKVLAAGRPKAWAGAYDKAVKLRQALDAAEPQVAKAFVGRPLAVALTRELLGSAYLDLDDAAQAVKQLQQALTLRQTVQGPDHPDTVACRNNLARAFRLADRTSEAGALYKTGS